jgi:hypothetical protein
MNGAEWEAFLEGSPAMEWGVLFLGLASLAFHMALIKKIATGIC